MSVDVVNKRNKEIVERIQKEERRLAIQGWRFLYSIMDDGLFYIDGIEAKSDQLKSQDVVEIILDEYIGGVNWDAFITEKREYELNIIIADESKVSLFRSSKYPFITSQDWIYASYLDRGRGNDEEKAYISRVNIVCATEEMYRQLVENKMIAVEVVVDGKIRKEHVDSNFSEYKSLLDIALLLSNKLRYWPHVEELVEVLASCITYYNQLEKEKVQKEKIYIEMLKCMLKSRYEYFEIESRYEGINGSYGNLGKRFYQVLSADFDVVEWVRLIKGISIENVTFSSKDNQKFTEEHTLNFVKFDIALMLRKIEVEEIFAQIEKLSKTPVSYKNNLGLLLELGGISKQERSKLEEKIQYIDGLGEMSFVVPVQNLWRHYKMEWWLNTDELVEAHIEHFIAWKDEKIKWLQSLSIKDLRRKENRKRYKYWEQYQGEELWPVKPNELWMSSAYLYNNRPYFEKRGYAEVNTLSEYCKKRCLYEWFYVLIRMDTEYMKYDRWFRESKRNKLYLELLGNIEKDYSEETEVLDALFDTYWMEKAYQKAREESVRKYGVRSEEHGSVSLRMPIFHDGMVTTMCNAETLQEGIRKVLEIKQLKYDEQKRNLNDIINNKSLDKDYARSLRSLLYNENQEQKFQGDLANYTLEQLDEILRDRRLGLSKCTLSVLRSIHIESNIEKDTLKVSLPILGRIKEELLRRYRADVNFSIEKLMQDESWKLTVEV